MEYLEIVKRLQEENDGLHEGKITLGQTTGLMLWLRQKLDPNNWVPKPNINSNVTAMHSLYLESLKSEVTPEKLNAFGEKLTLWLIDQPITTHLVIDYHPCKALRDLAEECGLPEDIFPIKHHIFFEPGKTWVQLPDMSFVRVS